MVKTEYTLPDGSTVNVAKAENRAWKEKRDSSSTVSTLMAIEDLVTDAVLVRNEHEPDEVVSISSTDFAQQVREGEIVPIDREDLPEELRL
ncbi:hypothetical protein [Halorhabdus rudnickae]|uniref:hypothetical protein n=1 Tax=Halorhabdus rudnickae TaxID=1775544 RepID=UPI001082AE5E|nr:hypothetical protein [Halorhabdus rudnickae]